MISEIDFYTNIPRAFQTYCAPLTTVRITATAYRACPVKDIYEYISFTNGNNGAANRTHNATIVTAVFARPMLAAAITSRKDNQHARHAHIPAGKQDDERRRHEQLIGNRVEELAEIRHLPAALREVPVQLVGQADAD